MPSTSHTVRSHYDRLLAPVYAWMVGDLDAAYARARAEIERLGPRGDGTVAVDLGAGLGLHARALAESGHETVWMLDTNADLLDAARQRTGDHQTYAVEADLTGFAAHVPLPVDTIVCMGDTLTHLAAADDVGALLELVAGSLRPGGVFLTTFRDYSVEREGVDRFVLVRSDTERILTVFVEYGADTVTIHDVLHERHGHEWSLQVGSYPKLRLDPAWVAAVLEDHGLSVETGAGFSGLTEIVATRH